MSGATTTSASEPLEPPLNPPLGCYKELQNDRDFLFHLQYDLEFWFHLQR